MNRTEFTVACARVKSQIGPYTMTHRQLALVLGIAPSEFRQMEARYEFPWDHLKALSDRFPELDIDLATFPELSQVSSTKDAQKPTSNFELPSLEEMAVYMDAEMARMGIPPQGAAA